MAKNIKRHITHIKSNVVENNKPKLPQADDINFGEIAVNYADGYETISIKTVKPDNTPSITPFSSDEYYTKQKLGNGFTGVNSGRTVTDALSAMDAKKTDVSAFTAHTASTVHMNPTEKTNLDSLAANIGAISGITSQMVYNWNTASANTHTHDNKTILDKIAQTDVTHWNDAYDKRHTHSNKNILDGVSETKVSNWDTAYNNTHTHHNKEVLDNIGQTDIDHWDDGYRQRHTHSNKAILDSITEAYTTAEQTKLSGIADGAQVNAIETVKVNGTALTPDSSKAVNVIVPTTTSELTNNSNFVSDASYVHTDNNYTTTEKNKLSGIEAGAEANKNAFSNIQVGDVTVAADSQTDTVTLNGGGIVSIEANDSNDTITISASNAVTSVAGKTGVVILNKSDVGLNNVDNTADADKKVASAATAAVAESVEWNNVGGKPSSFTPSAHNHASNEVTAMTGYAKASAEAAISASDTLNVAIGKLEKGLDGKQPTGDYAYKSDLSDFFNRAEYEMSGSSHVINFYHGNTLIDTINADAFIKDGMVDNVVISDGNLVITFNTDSGKQPITIPLTNIFNPNNYYQKDKFTDSVSVKFNRNGDGSSETISAEVKNISAATFDSTSKTVGTKFSELNDGKQDKLVSGSNIKTINGNSILGSGDITIGGGGSVTVDSELSETSENPVQNKVITSALKDKQDELVSGQNIKTINNTSILGSGNIDIQGGSTYSAGRGISISNNQISVSLPISAGTGANSIIEGSGTTASGDYSHAEGLYTIASSPSSHAEGESTTASGSSSHAEGESTKAFGNYSHAEGEDTEANGDGSHAEGYNTRANGFASHAEGDGPTASGYASHAEGNSATASGECSHAEGNGTTASGDYSHAEGNETTASGDYSHTEGYNTTAEGNASHAEGSDTVASGSSSHAEGNSTTANGYASHAEGDSTTARGYASHTEGENTTANNASEHACGQFNVSSSASTTFGNSGNTLFSVGNGTANNARHNAFEIRQNGDIYIVKGGSDVKLQDQLGGGGASVVELTNYSSSSDVSLANVYTIGGLQTESRTITGSDMVDTVVYHRTDGGNNYSYYVGEYAISELLGKVYHISNIYSEGNVPSGIKALFEQPVTAGTGTNSVIEGSGTTASGVASHAEGFYTTANGFGSHAEGLWTITTNDAEHACGQYNVSSSASTTFGDSGNTLFSVGNGEDDFTKHNAFEIRQNGTLIISIENTTLTLDETKLNKLIQLLN